MSTEGEALWAGLLDRNDLVGQIAKRTQLVAHTIDIGPYVHNFSGYVPVSSYTLGELVYRDLPKIVDVTFTLWFQTFQPLGYGSYAKVRVWREVLWTGTPLLGYTLRIPAILTRMQLRAEFTLLATQGMAKKFTSPVNRKFWFSARPPTGIARYFESYSAYCRAQNGLTVLSKHKSFASQSKKQTSPIVINGTFVDGTEQLGVPWSSTTGHYERYRRTWSSVNTPGFGKLKGTDLPVNPYTLTEQTTDLGQGLHFRKKADNSAYFNKSISSLNIIDNIPSLPAFNSQVYNRAIANLASKAGSSVDNIAQDFVQWRQTTDLVASTAIRLVTALKAVHRFDFSGAAKALYNPRRPGVPLQRNPSKLKSTANNWLEFQYGWKPLLQDIQGVMHATARLYSTDGRDYVRTVRASANYRSESDWPITYASQPAEFGAPIPSVWPIISLGHRMELHSVTLRMRYKMASRAKAFFAQTGFTSPVNLAWEVLPWSFVVDWFLPIGPYLEAFSSFEGMEFLEGSATYFYRIQDTARVSFTGRLVRTPSFDSRVRAERFYKQVSVQRVKLLAPPTPNLPTFKNPLSIVHATNALALLSSVFKRK